MQKYVFLADHFNDYMGGAELSTHALIEKTPSSVVKLRSTETSIKQVEALKDHLWVITNYADCHPRIIQYIAENLKYVCVEYDYKVCAHRSPQLHEYVTGSPCDCDIPERKLLYRNAKHVFFMSEAQQSYFEEKTGCKGSVLSSIFDIASLDIIKELRNRKIEKKEHYIVVHSSSWVKGVKETVKYCVLNALHYRFLCSLGYRALLEEFAGAKGFAYHPAGWDTCPRTVIEAKLLGCELLLNDNVQHKDEDWFNGTDEEILEYLETRPDEFWTKIREIETALDNGQE